jgi:hypothetical protein
MGSGAPARASKSTTSTILIGVAAAATLLTAVNASNRNRNANTTVGYMSNGDRVYQDGHVMQRNGQTYYPSDRGQTLQCNGRTCTMVGSNGNYRGHHYKETHHETHHQRP